MKVGGLYAGNDYYTGHVAAAGVTFGVKDAVDEFAAVRNLRVYVTAGNDPDGCCPDWYVLKCGECIVRFFSNCVCFHYGFLNRFFAAQVLRPPATVRARLIALFA